MKTLATLIFVCASTPVAAQCPTGIDAADGITMIRNAPFFGVTNQLLDDNIVREKRLTNRDGETEHITAFYKFGFIVLTRISETSTLELKYQSDFAELEMMNAGTIWHGTADLLEDGTKIGDIENTIWVETTETVTIAKCTFEVIRIRNSTIVNGGDPINFSRLYSPELGFILDAIRMDVNWQPVSQVAFDEIQIGTRF